MRVLSRGDGVSIENGGGGRAGMVSLNKYVCLFLYSKSEINSARVHPEQDGCDALIQ